MLEVGAGDGSILKFLADANFAPEYAAVEISESGVEHIKLRNINNLKSIQLFDIEGRILETFIENKNNATLDISSQKSGIYFLKILTAEGSSTQKIIRE